MIDTNTNSQCNCQDGYANDAEFQALLYHDDMFMLDSDMIYGLWCVHNRFHGSLLDFMVHVIKLLFGTGVVASNWSIGRRFEMMRYLKIGIQSEYM